MNVLAYTDGSSRGNPGPGGFGVILLLPEKKYKKEISKGFRLTTNNRMELLAVITALESLKHSSLEITIYTDSKYVSDAINKGWIWGWKKKFFKDVKNPDLWKRYLKISKNFKVNIEWVKGHAGNVWNERADKLATAVALSKNLEIDHYYEQENPQIVPKTFLKL